MQQIARERYISLDFLELYDYVLPIAELSARHLALFQTEKMLNTRI